MRLNLQLVVLLWTMAFRVHTDAANIISTSVNIIKLIHEVSEMVLKVWDLVEDFPIIDNKINILPDKQDKIMEQINQVNERVRHTEELQAEYFALTIETLKREFLTESLLAQKLNDVNDVTKAITSHYSDMTFYQISKEKMEPYTLESFAEWGVKTDSSSLAYLVEMLHFHVFGDPGDNENSTLFLQMVKKFETDEVQVCTVHLSSQQFAYDLFTKIALVEIKAFIMMEFSYMTLHNLGRGNFTKELSLMRSKHDQRVQHSQGLLANIVARSRRVYLRCDPEPWQSGLGKSYDHVSRLLQGYVANEINFNSKESCFDTCEDYEDAVITSCSGEDEFCKKQPKCSGRFHSCRFIAADLSVCQSNITTDRWRRYDFVNFDNGRTLGNDGQPKTCAGGNQRAESWSSYLFWRCNYCFCLCDEPGPLSDRFFNLRPTLSDYENNFIVTGAKFVKDQRVFHLQLQQGALLPGGFINQSSLAWIPLDSYNVTHVDIRNGFDYHELTYDSRAMDLDEISTSNDSLVVTGARFRVKEKHINLEVRFSAFNISTGRLIHPNVNSFWLSNDETTGNEDNPRQKLMLYDPQVSTKTALNSRPLSTNNQYMEFTSSSVDKDAAQNTVPFIDIQEVVPNPAVPLSGLGIYHRGRKGFGGYFAPKIVTYNLLQNLMKP